MDALSTLNRFVKAFEELDLEGMMECYTDDATSFFPVKHYHVRINGKTELRERFGDVLGKMRASGLNRVSLPVQGLKLDEYGETALATFQIRDNDLSRRTILLRKQGDRWLIAHLHASNAPLEAEN